MSFLATIKIPFVRKTYSSFEFFEKKRKKFPAGFLLLKAFGGYFWVTNSPERQKIAKNRQKIDFFKNLPNVTPNVWGGKEPHFKSFAGL